MAAFCTQCGSPVTEDDFFCPNCGSIIQKSPEEGKTAEQVPFRSTEEASNKPEEQAAAPMQPVSGQSQETPAPTVQAIPQPKEPISPALSSCLSLLWKKWSKHPKALILSGCGLALVIILAILIPVLIASQKEQHFLAYAVGDEVHLTLQGKEENRYELEGEALIPYYVCNEKQTKLLYMYGENDTLYYQDLTDKALRSGERIKIDDDISYYFEFSSDEKSVLYLTSNGDFFRYHLKSRQKERLFNGVSTYRLSEDDSTLIYLGEDEALYQADMDTQEKQKITAEADSISYVSEDAQEVFYIKDEACYRYSVQDNKSEKLASDIIEAFSFNDNGTFYYTKNEEVSTPISDLIDDDLLEADTQAAKDEKPLTLRDLNDTIFYPDNDSSYFNSTSLYIYDMTADGFSFDLNDWYNGFDGGKAEFTDDNTAVYTTTDYNGNGKLENTFTLKMENDRPVIQVTNKMIEEAPDGEGTEAPIVAEGKYYISYSWEKPLQVYQLRNQLREDIKGASVSYTKTNLFYYNGKEDVKVCENYLESISRSDLVSADEEKNIICYYRNESAAPEKVKMSEYFDTEENISMFSLRIAAGEENPFEEIEVKTVPCISVAGTESIVNIDKEKGIYDIKVEDSGYLYYVEKEFPEAAGTLFRAKISDKGIGESETVYDDVSSYVLSDGEIWYFRDGEEGSDVADLYYKDQSIAYDVKMDSLSILDGAAFFQSDCDSLAQMGTFCVFKNGKTQQLAYDVSSFSALNENYVALIHDCNDGAGELSVYTGKKELTHIDYDVDFIIQLK